MNHVIHFNQKQDLFTSNLVQEFYMKGLISENVDYNKQLKFITIQLQKFPSDLKKHV